MTQSKGAAQNAPLFNKDVEDAVIAGLVTTDNTLMLERVFTEIEPEHFYISWNREAYRKCRTLYESGKTIDVITVSDGLDNGPYIYTILPLAPVSLVTHIGIIKDLFTRRKIQQTAQELNALAHDRDKPIEIVVSESSSAAFSISATASKDDGLSLAGAIADEIEHDVDQRILNPKPYVELDSGYADYNYIMGGLHETNFTIIAARPSIGKTALAINMACRMSINKNIPSLFFSLEMAQKQLVSRAIPMMTLIDNESIKTGTLDGSQISRFKGAIQRIKRAPLIVTDKPQTLSTLVVNTRKAVRQFGIKVVWIDYLQMLRIAGYTRSRDSELTEIAYTLKELAKECKVDVVALSQLNRNLEYREDKRPILPDLRESGGIEQAADVVLALHREHHYDETADPHAAELLIRKHRNGALGTIDLYWNAPCFRFDEISTRVTGAPAI